MAEKKPLAQQIKDGALAVLSEPFDYPDEFKSWVPRVVESSGITLPGTETVYPYIVDIDVYATAITHTNWDTLSANQATLTYNASKDSSGAQNDEIGWDVLLSPGIWTFELLHSAANSRGIYTVTLDGVSVGTIDGYAAVAAPNTRSTITGISVPTAAVRRLLLKMATKHASSSNYYGLIQHAQFRRTA